MEAAQLLTTHPYMVSRLGSGVRGHWEFRRDFKLLSRGLGLIEGRLLVLIFTIAASAG